VSKTFIRKRVGSKTSSLRHDIEQQQLESSSAPKVAGEDNDVEKTPKSKNSRGLSSNLLMRRASGSEIDSVEPDGKKKPTKPTDKLAMFLQAHASDSSGDEYETDHKSMGARSLPAHMHSTYSNPLETAEKEEDCQDFHV
jgi:hypothetical protein